MTPRASKSKAPLRRDEKRKISEIEQIARKFQAEGMSKSAAYDRAHMELRKTNPKGSR